MPLWTRTMDGQEKATCVSDILKLIRLIMSLWGSKIAFIYIHVLFHGFYLKSSIVLDSLAFAGACKQISMNKKLTGVYNQFFVLSKFVHIVQPFTVIIHAQCGIDWTIISNTFRNYINRLLLQNLFL